MNISAATGALSAAERSYPTSEVRGRSREDPMPEGPRPRGLTPRQRSGAAAKSARLQRRRNGRKELPASEDRGRDREEIPSVRGQVRPWKELTRVRGQGQRLRGATPRPRPRVVAGRTNPTSRELSCMGTGGPRGAIPRWRSGRAAVRRYPSSKVRSNGCALLEQPWRDIPRPR